jgi:hypothetical protein
LNLGREVAAIYDCFYQVSWSESWDYGDIYDVKFSFPLIEMLAVDDYHLLVGQRLNKRPKSGFRVKKAAWLIKHALDGGTALEGEFRIEK